MGEGNKDLNKFGILKKKVCVFFGFWAGGGGKGSRLLGV